MSGKAEEIKGRVKEAAGVMTNDERLKQEGKIDQASGKVKQAAEHVIDKARDAAKGNA
ncbi:MAG TPA: CsbD family protein [Candidatus Binataceae bacterium]|nr:CsbD family protein [Candidatus Binataceae bacterium]